MAKKGQKFKKYNDEFRNKVVNDYNMNTDYKVFTQSEMTFCVGQITSMYREELDNIREKMIEYIKANNEKWTGNNDKSLVNKSIASTILSMTSFEYLLKK